MSRLERKNPIKTVCGLLVTVVALGACSGTGTPDAGGSGGTGGVTTVSLADAIREQRQCGGADCGSQNTCCLGANGDICGLELPTDVFTESCVLNELREGALDSTCAESRNYCPEFDGEPCIFPGCRRADGACGFWVEDYWVFNKAEGFVVKLADNLGCLAVEEFVP